MMGYMKPFDPADVWNYATRTLTQTRCEKIAVVSDNLRFSSDNVNCVSPGGTWTTIKKVILCRKGRMKMKFDIKTGGSAKYRIVVDDEIIYTSDHINETNYTTKTHEISTKCCSVIEIQVYSSTCWVKNMRFYYDLVDQEGIAIV